MPWNGQGQRLANRNDMSQKPITTSMASTPRFKVVDDQGKTHTIWAFDWLTAYWHAEEQGWKMVEENTDEVTITTHKPGKVRSTPF